MSKKLSTLFQCPLPPCGGKTRIEFIKPNYFKPTRTKIQCSECNSSIEVLIRKVKGSIGQVNIEPQVFHLSDEMVQALDKMHVEQAKEQLAKNESEITKETP